MHQTAKTLDSDASLLARGWRPSIRLLVLVLVIAPLTLLSIALGFIASLTSRSISEQLGQQIVANATQRVSTDVRSYLASAMRVSELYTRRLQDGLLTSSDLPPWERMMFHDLATNSDVASICFADPQGNCTWLLHAHGRLELGKVKGTDREHAIEYPADEQGKIDWDHPIRVYHYDATQRPWFTGALSRTQPSWTPVYFWFGAGGPASETGAGYARIVNDRSGKTLGVLVIDVTLSSLSDRLRQISNPSGGSAFIIDDEGLLVAASEGAVNSKTGARLMLRESDSPAARAVAIFSEQVRNQSAAQNPAQARTVEINGHRARAYSAAIAPYRGIHWQVITLLPEQAFLADTDSMQRRATLLAVAAVAGGLSLTLLLSRRLTRPLIELTHHVGRIGAGDLDSQLNLTDTRELCRLSDELNQMAGGLKERLSLERSLAVASQMQQGLLPQSVPIIDGLQIAASSHFAESTGGDYYDFIERRKNESDELLIAVGDVTGHGIGAALLMATARGAVRAACGASCPLEKILADTNRVLCASTRRGMFMTLALIAVDRSSLTVRWATAGHDPALVYYPQNDSFKELSTDGIPLGIEESAEFCQQQSQCSGPGFIIVLGTDGIWEARNKAGEMFGKQRLRDLMRAHHGSASEAARAIESALATFLETVAIQDDTTFVVLKAV